MRVHVSYTYDTETGQVVAPRGDEGTIRVEALDQGKWHVTGAASLASVSLLSGQSAARR
jgi:hypothetical protein